MSVRRWRRRGLVGIVIACSTLLVVSCGSAGRSAKADPPEESDIVLIDLDDAAEAARWTPVNDPVMGGRSTSRVTSGEGGLVFSGNISLANNGGFASARSPQDPEIGRRATGAASLRVHARGDGKTYLVKVGVEGQPYSYIQRFHTEAGIQRTYELSVADFEPVGRRLDPAPDAPQKLDPSRMNQVAVYILDKQQGPFEITISSIDATV